MTGIGVVDQFFSQDHRLDAPRDTWGTAVGANGGTSGAETRVQHGGVASLDGLDNWTIEEPCRKGCGDACRLGDTRPLTTDDAGVTVGYPVEGRGLLGKICCTLLGRNLGDSTTGGIGVAVLVVVLAVDNWGGGDELRWRILAIC